MLILQIMKHSPESCPLGNPANLATVIQWLENLGPSAANLGISVVGVWTDRAGHVSYAIFDTPSMEAFTSLEVDPANIPLLTFNSIEKKVVTSASETLAFFKARQATM